jgi:hypothetical protein
MSLLPIPPCRTRYAATIANAVAKIWIALVRRIFATPLSVYMMFQSFHCGKAHRLQK